MYHLRNIIQRVRDRHQPEICEHIAQFLRTVDREQLAQLKRPEKYEKKIEILIPCFNHASFLFSAWQSVLRQLPMPITVTFIDDASTDDTPKIIERAIESAPRHIATKVVKNESTLRQWASINKAVAASDNELFMILNDDDMLTPDALEKTLETYRRRPNIFMLGAHSIWFDDESHLPEHTLKSIDELVLTLYEPPQALRYRHLNDLNMTHSSSSFFRPAWMLVGGYFPKEKRVHPQANEDRDFQMRVSAIAPVAVYRDYPFAYWRVDSSHGPDY